MKNLQIVLLIAAGSFLANAASANDGDFSIAPVGSVELAFGYNTEVGASVSGRLEHGQFLGGNHAISLGFALSADEQAYDLMLRGGDADAVGPTFEYVLGHASAKRQSTFGLDTTESFFKPRAVYNYGLSRVSLGAVLSKDEVSNAFAAPAVLRAEVGERNLYGLSAGYSREGSGGYYAASGEVLTSGDGIAFGKAELAARYKYKANQRGLVLEARFAAGTIGVMQGSTSVIDRFVPSSGALRGFEAGGFGSVDASGTHVGSTNYAVVSFGARQKGLIASLPDLSLGAFVDLGSAWGFDSGGDPLRAQVDDAAKLRSSAGFTIGQNFGPGHIELVVAFPLQHESADRLQELQLNFTTKF
ncbi:BamA/TamA family outer membrane protein [Planktotalea arctica]|uniref:BamA/TamA family outer membrane protein n=1 Tax=Planktotalea arctica TaxID=1481893 RepID=UPI00321B2095